MISLARDAYGRQSGDDRSARSGRGAGRPGKMGVQAKDENGNVIRRVCLSCDTEFNALGKFNRLCDYCNARNMQLGTSRDK
jgi:hypothetical protein